jgi:hypothetical protein
MKHIRTFACAEVTYRATAAEGHEAELRLFIDPDAATVADAWSRLTALYRGLDPRTLEIEIRLAPRRAPVPLGA